MLINNSTRILNDSWDRDKWKTIATSVRKKKKCGYKCANFGWPQKRWWSRFLKQPGGGRGERKYRLVSPAGICWTREGEETICLCLSAVHISPALGAGISVCVCVQVLFGAKPWQFLALPLWESQLLAAINPCKHSQCSYFPKPWQSPSSSILLHFGYRFPIGTEGTELFWAVFVLGGKLAPLNTNEVLLLFCGFAHLLCTFDIFLLVCHHKVTF